MIQNSLNGTNDSLMGFDNEPHILENTFIRAGLILLYSSIFLICFFGNLAVILGVSLQRKSRSVSKFCLWNMAVANFSVSLFCILQNLMLYLLETWILGELMCKMFHFISNLCHAASILTVVLISMERYAVLVHSLRCRRILTTRTLVVMILAVWILSAAINLPRFVYFGLTRIQLNENGESGDICVPIQPMYNRALADTIYSLVLYFIPVTVMSVLYFRIGRFLRQRERLIRELDEENYASIQDTSPGNQLESNDTQLDGPNIEGSNSVREVRAAPEGLKSLPFRSDSPPSPNFTKQKSHSRGFRGSKESLKRLRLAHVRCKQRQRVIRRFIYIVVTFAVLNLPFHLRKLCLHYLSSFDEASDAKSLFAILTYALMYANCALNPLLYAFMSKTFRASLRNAFVARSRNTAMV